MEFFFSLQHRDWGGGFAAEDEASLWKRVSSNHALNALSLARQVDSELKKREVLHPFSGILIASVIADR